jgi:hypothetical protein
LPFIINISSPEPLLSNVQASTSNKKSQYSREALSPGGNTCPVAVEQRKLCTRREASPENVNNPSVVSHEMTVIATDYLFLGYLSFQNSKGVEIFEMSAKSDMMAYLLARTRNC